ncbi:hypothetical protein DSO57_1021616 [Entomophthora muscae]|uniref:Uncharacterized protein n=1 Tax=Entomophthora muscae TaxID=34485 RepID=A0ACC2RI31_9FUNG|nr:hypothetical protein DSO57_1021616 [Entomophthora muscae]
MVFNILHACTSSELQPIRGSFFTASMHSSWASAPTAPAATPSLTVHLMASSRLLSPQVHCHHSKAFQPWSSAPWLSYKATFLNGYDAPTGHNGYFWTLVEYFAH